MRARVSRISLLVFAIMLVAGVVGDLSVAGNAWLWISVSALFAVIPVIVGPHRHRRIGVVGLILCTVLILVDYIGGKQLQKMRERAPHANQDHQSKR